MPEQREIVITVATMVNDGYIYEDDYTGREGYYENSLNVEVTKLEELIKQEWFLKYLKDHFHLYSKDDVAANSEVAHLDSYLFSYNRGYSVVGDYWNYTENPNDHNLLNTDKIRVFQEVAGPERIAQLNKIFDGRKKFQKKLKDNEKNAKIKAAERKEKARLKKIEKAKKLLEELNAHTT